MASRTLPALLLALLALSACADDPDMKDSLAETGDTADSSDTGTDTHDTEDTGIPEGSYELPAVTGPYSIGRLDLDLVDESRLESFSKEKDDLRELMVYVFYPAVPQEGPGNAPYVDPETAAVLHETLPAWLPEDLDQKIITHAFLGAEPAHEGSYPLLIFSPGYGVPVRVYQVWIEELVSRGYVVAAIDPPYLSGLVVYYDGRTVEPAELSAAELDSAITVASGDYRFVLDYFLEAREDTMGVLHGIASKTDTSRVAAWGHSYGGAASVASCFEDSRFKAAIDLDGSLWGDVVGQDPGCPMLIDLSDGHFGDKSVSQTFDAATEPSYLARFADTGHLSFTDGPFLVAGLNPDIPPSEWPAGLDFGAPDLTALLQSSRALHRSFFGKYLRGESLDPIDAVASWKQVSVERN